MIGDPEHTKELYRRMIALAGETVLVRRFIGTGETRPKFEASVRARVTDYETKELVGNIAEGDRRVVFLAEDLVAAHFPLNLGTGDKIVVRGRECEIRNPDDNTRRTQGVLIAYELQVRG